MSTKTNRRKVTQTLADAAGKTKLIAAAPPENEVAFIVDASYSMHGWEDEVVRTINEQFDNVRAVSEDEDQVTRVTLRLFSTTVDRPILQSQDVRKLRNWTRRNYVTRAQTALYDAIGLTLDDFDRRTNSKDENVSFLLIVITDGCENASRRYQNSIAKRIRDAQMTDRYSIVCLVPPGYRDSTACKLGVPLGNVREWEQSERGFAEVRSVVSTGLRSYYEARSSGLRNTRSFFVDTGHIVEADLDNLDDVSGNFYVWNVDTVPDGAKVRIDDFVRERIRRNSKLRRLGDFEKGRGYYELTKPEKVQPSKTMVIQDLDTGKMYGGAQARSLLGLPTGEYINVRPGSHSKHRIFILSTSINRNLIGGTKFLYRKP